MSRTIVLLNRQKEQITNSSPGPANHAAELERLFPQAGTMPQTLAWNGRTFELYDQPTHATDEPETELFRYIESA